MIHEKATVECPICNSTDVKFWFIKNDFNLYTCKKCTHRFAAVEKNYLVPENLDHYRFPERKWLDIGSGSGYLLQQVKKNGWNETGVEPGGWGVIAAQEKKV